MTTNLEYKELKEKWEDGIVIDKNTTKKDVGEYIDWKYFEYGTATDSDLWECYQADFGATSQFTAEIFNILPVRKLQELKNYLLGRGVYIIPNDKKVTIAASLYQCAQEEDQHNWTTEEALSVHGKRIKFVSEILLEMIGLQQQQPQSQYAALPKYQAPQSTSTISVTPSLSPQTPVVAPRPMPGHGRELANLAKLYTDELKYSGMNESLRQKLTIFFDMCNRADVPQEAYLKAFPTMLKGMALTHFYNTNASQICNYDFGKVVEHIQKFFEGPGFQRKNLDEWNKVTLNSIIAENAGKTMSQSLQLLVIRLQELQHGLEENLHHDSFLHNKIVTSCQGIAACRYAVSDPPLGIGPLINKLQSSIMAFEKEMNPDQTQAYYTDRRYHRDKEPYPDRGKSTRERITSGRSSGRCFVCGKENCRSWKHTDKERDEAKVKFRAKFTPSQANSPRFPQKAKQYIADMEIGDPDSDSDLDEAFNALVITIPKEDIEPEQPDQSSFVTSFGEIDATNAIATVTDLTDRACQHALITSEVDWIL